MQNKFCKQCKLAFLCLAKTKDGTRVYRCEACGLYFVFAKGIPWFIGPVEKPTCVDILAWNTLAKCSWHREEDVIKFTP